MIGQIRDWFRGLRLGERPMAIPFVVLYQEVRILAESHLSTIKGLVCGMVFGSSAALPFLWPLNLRGLYLLDFGFFVCSAILFTVMNGADIAINGHYTLAGFIVIGTVVVLSQRISLEEFGPYVPVSVGLSLLVTVHVVPWIKTLFHRRNRITLGDYVTATGGDHPGGSYRAVVDTSSVRSSERFHGSFTRGWRADPLELRHMNGAYLMTTRPDSPEHSSSLDLETGLSQQGRPSPSRAAHRSGRSQQAAEDQSSRGFTENMDRTWTTDPLDFQITDQGGNQTPTGPYLPEHSRFLGIRSGSPQQDLSSTALAAPMEPFL